MYMYMYVTAVLTSTLKTSSLSRFLPDLIGGPAVVLSTSSDNNDVITMSLTSKMYIIDFLKLMM